MLLVKSLVFRLEERACRLRAFKNKIVDRIFVGKCEEVFIMRVA